MKLFVIFPARNESKTIAQCIETARKSKYDPEILVVDGFSSDTTKKEATSAGATVIDQSEGVYPGKGRALKDGIKEAIRRGADCILFLDADIVNLTPEWVNQLAEPVVEKGFDMSRGYYRRAEYDGAVTKLVARPLSWVFFPEISHFEQPLSGEICATTKLLKDLIKSQDWPDGWGIDIWMLVEAAMKDYQIVEVYLGTKVHTSRQDYLADVVRLTKMAEQVSLTTFKEAIKYKRVDNVKRVPL
jgi:glycosyltransferase involved in cell wall biosynthesis